jgi:hypothetical protein
VTKPTPRPALRKAPDAHIHPAAPGHSLHLLRPARNGSPGVPEPRTGAEAIPDGEAEASTTATSLSGPLRGTTSDSLRNATRKARRPPQGKSADKLVDLKVRVPKSLRKEFQAAAKADKKDPDAVVAALLKAWLGT